MPRTTYGHQKRFLDPFSPVDSDAVSQLTAIYSAKGRGILQGFELSKDPQTSYYLVLSKGIILKDYVVIRYLDDLPINLTYFDLTPSVKYYVVLDYVYKKTSPPPVAGILFVTDQEYNETRQLKLGTVKVDGDGNILELTDEGREYGDIINHQTVNQVVSSCLEGAINSFPISCLCDINTLTAHDGYVLRYDEATCQWVSQELIIDTTNVNLSFLNLSDTPSSYDGKRGMTVVVNDTETGLEFKSVVAQQGSLPGGSSSSDIYLNNLVDVNFVGPQDNDVLTFDSLTGNWTACPSNSSTTFLGLDDTPHSYSGAEGYGLCVKNNRIIFCDFCDVFASKNHVHSWSDLNTSSSALGDLGDVSIPNTNYDNNVLCYDGSNWVPTSISSTDEYVKTTSSDTAGYLCDKVDNTTIITDNNKIKVIDNVFALCTHDHDIRYFTQVQINSFLADKADCNHTHPWNDVSKNGSSINDLDDVDITGEMSGCVLGFNGLRWVPVTPSSGGGGASSLNDLNDVNTSGASSGCILGFDGSTWVPVASTSTDEYVKTTSSDTAGYLCDKVDNTTIVTNNNKIKVADNLYASVSHTHSWNDVSKSGSSVNDLGDVNTSGASSGCVLCYNGTCWIPGTPSSSGGSIFTVFQNIKTDFDYHFNLTSISSSSPTTLTSSLQQGFYAIFVCLSIEDSNDGSSVFPVYDLMSFGGYLNACNYDVFYSTEIWPSEGGTIGYQNSEYILYNFKYTNNPSDQYFTLVYKTNGSSISDPISLLAKTTADPVSVTFDVYLKNIVSF